MSQIVFNVRVLNSNLPKQTRVSVNNPSISQFARYVDNSGLANFYVGSPFSSPIYTDILIDSPGYAPYSYFAETGNQVLFKDQNVDISITLTPSFRRPAPINHNSLPAFDQSDSGGIVHTTPPPELSIPIKYDRLFMRADFNGVTINTSRWGSNIPLFIGANTTPRSMLMSPMMIMYPRKWQDAYLTESAERNYSHYIFASKGWNFSNNDFNPSPSDVVTWAKYLKSWGFYATYWGNCQSNDPYLIALVNNNALDFFIVGEEIDSKVTPEQLTVILDTNLSIIANGCPVAVHFTSNYPDGFPRDTYFDGRSMPGFSDYNGRVHLCWQANPNDSAGTQGARLYYARQRVNLGLVAGDGKPAPDSLVFAFETMATRQLYDQCSEEYGCLRSLELLYCPAGMPGIRAVGGSGNGLRYPDGSCV